MAQIPVAEFKKVLETQQGDPSLDFINVCTFPEYKEKHIAGVRSVPLDTLEQHLNEFKNKKRIYVHCRSGKRAEQAIETLQNLGVTAELINVEGGILAWAEAGYETGSVTNRLPLIRQVLLTAGIFVTTGILLTQFVHPNFIFLSLFVGCGLMFAGITGKCGVSFVLARMPWNK